MVKIKSLLMAENTPFGYTENEDLDNFVFEDLTDQYLDVEYPYIEKLEEGTECSQEK